MIYLVGKYDVKLDPKGRFGFPMPWRKQLGDLCQNGFVGKPSLFSPCLELYPHARWQQVMQKMSKLNRFVERNNQFIRKFMGEVKMIEPDSSGRLMLTKNWMEFANMEKEVVITSAVDYLEIWNKENFQDNLKIWDKESCQDKVSNISIDEDFQKMVEEIMAPTE